MLEIQSNVPRSQEHGACCHRRMSETSPVYMESGQDS